MALSVGTRLGPYEIVPRGSAAASRGNRHDGGAEPVHRSPHLCAKQSMSILPLWECITMAGGDREVTLADLDARLREVEALQELILRILSTTKPLDNVLEQYGATKTQERAFYGLPDEMVARAREREQDRPTFPYFVMKVEEIFPSLRRDREFVALLIDTLKLERPSYRELYAYMAAHNWPTWT